MKVDAVLCDFAQVNGGKLYVTGAGINLVGTLPEPPHPLSLWVGMIITIPWTATNQVHQLRVSLRRGDNNEKVAFPVTPPPGVTLSDEDQGSQVARFNVGRAPILQAGEDSLMPVALPVQAALPALMSYSVVIEIDGSEMSRIAFRVLTDPMQAPGRGPASFGPTDIPRF